MARRIACCMALCFLVSLMCFSCSEDITETATADKAAATVSIGTVHNQFVKEYLNRKSSLKPGATRNDRMRLYIEAAQEVCKRENYDFTPTQDVMNDCLAMFDGWREAGIWDVFCPFEKSPIEVVERFAEAGIIPKENVPYLRTLIEDLCQANSKQEDVTLSRAPSADLEPARDLLQSSCELWREEMSTDDEVAEDTLSHPYPIVPYVPRWLDHFLKKASYYAAVGLADALAGWGAGAATGGYAPAAAFATGFVSLITEDTLEEGGLKP